ncbi:cardiolipin synthase [Vibrio sp. WJH972]
MDKIYQFIVLLSFVVYWLLVASVTIRVVVKKNAISVSLAWLLMIYVLPFIGVIAYFLFGELNLGRRRAERAREMFTPFRDWFSSLNDCQAHVTETLGTHIYKIDELCNQRMSIPALSGNHLDLKKTPNEIIDAMVEDIQQANDRIRMVFYIWHPGGKTDTVASALIHAAKRGVKVQILLDSAGSHRFFNSGWAKTMRSAGIEVVQALPVKPWRIFLSRLDLRQHRKIVVIDDQIAYTGSMNMVDPEFFKLDADVGQWVDIMVRVTGPTVNILSAIHSWDWEIETGERSFPQLPECQLDNPVSLHPVQVVPSGPAMPEQLIIQALIIAIHQANHSIRITSPYFVPSRDLLATLKMTAQRGINIDIIIPHKNDSTMVKWASRSFYGELLEVGINIYEFYGGLLHTKSVVIDERFCLIGTVNMDMRSLWLNFEVTLAVDDEVFTKQLFELQQEYIDQSYLIEKQQWQSRPLFNRFLERIYYLFNPLL